jgi:hypothetical protein
MNTITTHNLLNTAWRSLTPQQRREQTEYAFREMVDQTWCSIRDEYIGAMRAAILARVPAKRLEAMAFDLYAWVCHKYGYPFLVWEPLEEAEFTAHLIANLRYLHREWRDTLPFPNAPPDEGELQAYLAEQVPLTIQPSQPEPPQAEQLCLFAL